MDEPEIINEEKETMSLTHVMSNKTTVSSKSGTDIGDVDLLKNIEIRSVRLKSIFRITL
jgi:hypothetical protein